MRTLLYGTFRMAKKKKYIDYSISNIVKDIEISRKAFRKTVKEDDEEVFTEEELPIILKYLEDNQDIINLGILLVFKTGMRIGELVSLEPKDFCEDRIHIYKTEVKYKTEKGQMKYEVREFPKTEAGIRDIYIPKSCLWILKKIRSKNPFGEYVFERNGKRLRAYVFNNRLRTICKRLNIKPKSPHKIRKTYGTILLDSGVEESFIISQMGHTSIKTTKKHYYRNRKNSDGKSETINSIVGL